MKTIKEKIDELEELKKEVWGALHNSEEWRKQEEMNDLFTELIKKLKEIYYID